MKKSCCTCCGPFKPRYQRLVDNIFPLNPNDGLVRNNMEKLTFFALSSPEKLDRIGEYLAKKLTRDVSRKRYGNVFIAMEALDQLLAACHAQTLNLFVESFLKMVQKLLECEEPDLNILGTNSFVKFANIEEDAPSYHRRYDFFISKFASMCHNNSPDVRARLKIRKSGLRGIHAVVRKTVTDDLQVNIYEYDHMKKIVPSLLFNMHDPSSRASIDLGESEGVNKTDTTKEHRDKLNELAESCLRELVSKASYGTLKSLLLPLLEHFDAHHLWDMPDTFAVQVLRIIMYSVKPQHTHLVIDMLLAHLDKHANDVKIRTNIMQAISQIITLATVSSIGPSIHQWFNKMLWDLRRSVDVISDDPQVMKEEREFQEALIHTMGEFATNLPDYQKIEVLMFIMSQVPLPDQRDDGECYFLGLGVAGDDKASSNLASAPIPASKDGKANAFFPSGNGTIDSLGNGTGGKMAKTPINLKVRQDAKGRFITEPVTELTTTQLTTDVGIDPGMAIKSPTFIAQHLPGDTYQLLAQPSPCRVGQTGPGDSHLGQEQDSELPNPAPLPSKNTPVHKKSGNTRLQIMVLHSLLKVATKYKSIQFSTTFPSTFLNPLLRMSIVQDPSIRLIVQEILHTLLDRHDNLETLLEREPAQYEFANCNWSKLKIEKPSHLDNLFMRKSGSLFYSALYDSALRLNNGPDNLKSLLVTIALLTIEVGSEDVMIDLIRLVFALQKKCREYPFLRKPHHRKSSSVIPDNSSNSSVKSFQMRNTTSSQVGSGLDRAKAKSHDTDTIRSDPVLSDDVTSTPAAEEIFSGPALTLELRVHALVSCALSFLLLQIPRSLDPDSQDDPSLSFTLEKGKGPLSNMAAEIRGVRQMRQKGAWHQLSLLTLPHIALSSPTATSTAGGEDQMGGSIPATITETPSLNVQQFSCKGLLSDDTLFYRMDIFKESFRELGVDGDKLGVPLTLKSLIGAGPDPRALGSPDSRSVSLSSSRSNSFFFDSSSNSSSSSGSRSNNSQKCNESATDGMARNASGRRGKATKINYADININSMRHVLAKERTPADKEARDQKLKQMCEWYQHAPFEEIIAKTRCKEVENRKHMQDIIFRNITRSPNSFYDEPRYPPYVGQAKPGDGDDVAADDFTVTPKYHHPTSLLEMKFPHLIVY